jgi:dTDP-4-amino-4,6-dideoxygalactose transaminase
LLAQKLGDKMLSTRTKNWIPFNKPYLTGKELINIAQAHENAQLAGDGVFTRACQSWLEDLGGHEKALLTHSCTAALEMAALLCDINPGDEVILPSYTFVSTANAFVLRGAIPIFVDIRMDTLNIDESKIEKAITERTKVIVAVHYAGVSCEMDTIMDIANRHDIFVVEDAAQACLSKYKGRQLGSIGHLGCLSFHETKNIISGEGGALLINTPLLVERAEIIREKGTNRSRFIRGETDKYTWTDIGSSFLPGEMVAAFLLAQMECAKEITEKRNVSWNYYHQKLEKLEAYFRSPIVPKECTHNAHMFYLINQTGNDRQLIIESLKAQGIHTVFHYVPLHSSPFGRKFEKKQSELPITDFVSSNLIRLPMWTGLSFAEQDRIINHIQLLTKIDLMISN